MILKIKDNIPIRKLEEFGFILRREDNHFVKKVYLKNDNDDKNFYDIEPIDREIKLTRLDGQLDDTLYHLIMANIVEVKQV